jgi:sulfonate transport system substrate-binding protein
MSRPQPSMSRRAFVVTAAGGFAAAVATRAFAQAPLQKATLAYGSTGYTWSTTFLAEALGTWKAHGVDLNVVDFPTGRDAMQAMLAGSAQFSASTDTPFVLAALQGLRPIVAVNYSRYTHDMKITVRKEGPIDAAQPATLKGRKVATRVGTSAQYMLAKYLEMANLTMGDVQIIDMSPSDMSVALVRGDVDAFAWTGQAANVAAKQSGGKTTVMKQDGLEKFFQSHQLLLTTERVTKERPQLVEAAVRAVLDAENYMAKDASWPAKVAPRARTTPEEVRQATSTFEFRIGYTPRFVEDLVKHAEWAIAAGIAKRPAQDLRALFTSLIYTDATAKVLPDRVKLA